VRASKINPVLRLAEDLQLKREEKKKEKNAETKGRNRTAPPAHKKEAHSKTVGSDEGRKKKRRSNSRTPREEKGKGEFRKEEYNKLTDSLFLSKSGGRIKVYRKPSDHAEYEHGEEPVKGTMERGVGA